MLYHKLQPLYLLNWITSYSTDVVILIHMVVSVWKFTSLIRGNQRRCKRTLCCISLVGHQMGNFIAPLLIETRDIPF